MYSDPAEQMATGKNGAAVPKLRAFISYSHKDRKYGAQAKAVVQEVEIEAFLAHDDLRVSDEWRDRIIEELKKCDIFVPLLSENFLESEWAPQEVGFIISRPVVVIAPISLDGTKPFGFISHVQGRMITDDVITRELLVVPLARRMPRHIIPQLIKVAADARTFRSAEETMKPLVDLFPIFTPEEAQMLAEGSVRNNQIWLAHLCKDKYLPELIRVHGANIQAKTLRTLRYQLENGRWHKEES